MGTNSFDGRYDYTKPWVNNPYNNGEETADPKSWTYNGPWSSNMEKLTQQALLANTMPASQLQALVRPPLPQVHLFPPRFGFGPRPQIEIDDVITLDRVYTEPRVSWYSGSPSGYSGSSRNSLEGI
jgi:hypothetical protein